jgi:hypothetical protein
MAICSRTFANEHGICGGVGSGARAVRATVRELPLAAHTHHRAASN